MVCAKSSSPASTTSASQPASISYSGLPFLWCYEKRLRFVFPTHKRNADFNFFRFQWLVVAQIKRVPFLGSWCVCTVYVCVNFYHSLASTALFISRIFCFHDDNQNNRFKLVEAAINRYFTPHQNVSCHLFNGASYTQPECTKVERKTSYVFLYPLCMLDTFVLLLSISMTCKLLQYLGTIHVYLHRWISPLQLNGINSIHLLYGFGKNSCVGFLFYFWLNCVCVCFLEYYRTLCICQFVVR